MSKVWHVVVHFLMRRLPCSSRLRFIIMPDRLSTKALSAEMLK